MVNPLLTRVYNKTVDNFTTDFGIKFRRVIGKPFRFVLRKATKRKVIIDRYPKLKKDETYIFVSNHSFDEDIVSGLGNIDRNAWLLNGSTHQLKYNPQMYAAWVNGMIYVSRTSDKSRKDSVKKMLRILDNKSSIFMFPEGGWNNTENLLMQPLFSGPWILARETGCKVVPLVSFNEHDDKNIYIRVADPLDIGSMEKEKALTLLRDQMATMIWMIMEEHCEIAHRSQLSYERFMDERRREYMHAKWRADVWDEELTFYHDKNHPLPQKIREFVDNVAITVDNAWILAPILVQREIDKKHDFTAYMHENWDKDN